MKSLDILMPMMFLMVCVFVLILMARYGIAGGNWTAINTDLIILIPSLFGIILGLYVLLKRR